MDDVKSALIPSGTDVFLDHVGAFVEDHRAAARQLRKLGFTLTRFARHVQAGADGAQQPSGTGNQCVMFREGYLEILSATGEETPLAEQFRAALGRYEGLHLIAFAAADAEARHAALPARRFKPLPLVRLRRPIPIPGGEALSRFDVVRLPPGAMPEGRIQIVTHHTPELVWRPNLLIHANGAEALTGVVVCVDDPAEAAIRFSRFVDGEATFVDPARSELALQRGRVLFARASTMSEPFQRQPSVVPSIVAVAIRCRDLGRLAVFLDGAAIPHGPSGDRLVIAPDHALGMTMIFHDAAKGPWD